MRFKLSAEAKKYLNSLDRNAVSRVYEALRLLTKEPPTGDIKRLQGKDDTYRLRVGDLRVVFEIAGNDVIIDKIAPRGQAYKGGKL